MKKSDIIIWILTVNNNLFVFLLKVVDLRSSSKKLEMQALEMEEQNESLAHRVQNLSQTVQQVRLESERRIVLLQQKHEDKIYLVMRYLANDGSSGNGGAIKEQLQSGTLTGTKGDKGRSLITRITSIARTEVVPRQLQPNTSGAQAKVTYQNNKLYFQQTNKSYDYV